MTDVALTPWRWIQFVLGAGWLILVMSLSGCETKEAKPISMTGVVYILSMWLVHTYSNECATLLLSG